MRNCAHHTGDQACFIVCSPWQPGQPAGRLHHRPNQTIPQTQTVAGPSTVTGQCRLGKPGRITQWQYPERTGQAVDQAARQCGDLSRSQNHLQCEKENFLSTPRHKTSINSWLIDCSARTFRLTSMVLFDENGRQIASYTYNDSQIKAMPVTQNSASFQQMQYVCKGLAGF
jgi:hypothetical protein